MQKGAKSFSSFSFLLDLPGLVYYISFYVKFKVRMERRFRHRSWDLKERYGSLDGLDVSIDGVDITLFLNSLVELVAVMRLRPLKLN